MKEKCCIKCQHKKYEIVCQDTACSCHQTPTTQTDIIKECCAGCAGNGDNFFECKMPSCQCLTQTHSMKEWWEMEFDKHFIVSQTLDYREWTAVHQENDIKDFIKLVITQELARRKKRILKRLPKEIPMSIASSFNSDAGAGHTLGHNCLLQEATKIINEEMES